MRRLSAGETPIVIDRTVLEWRLDPTSGARIPEARDHDVEVVVACRQGDSSSLAAASLRAIGLGGPPTCWAGRGMASSRSADGGRAG